MGATTWCFLLVCPTVSSNVLPLPVPVVVPPFNSMVLMVPSTSTPVVSVVLTSVITVVTPSVSPSPPILPPVWTSSSTLVPPSIPSSSSLNSALAATSAASVLLRSSLKWSPTSMCKCPSSPCTVLSPLPPVPLALPPLFLPTPLLLPVPPLLPTDACATVTLSLAISVWILFTDSTLSLTTAPRTSMISILSPFLPSPSPP